MTTGGPLTYLSLCGLLGYGYPAESLKEGLRHDPDFIGVDAGSTDPGPYYLGSGRSFVGEAQVRRDLAPVLRACVERKIPLIVGSAGGSGAAPHVDRFMSILTDIAGRHRLRFTAAVIYTDIGKGRIRDALDRDLMQPCGPAPAISPDTVDRLCNPVAQVGTGPIVEALSHGADIVVCGRCCDTAVFAAMPIMQGFDPALSLHCAKIAECGTLCAEPGGANDSLLCTIYDDHFQVVPANPQRRCTPRSVAAHSLYEQPDPARFFEPEGEIDMTSCTISAADDRCVTVAGTVLKKPDVETVKLEGAERKGYRSMALAGVADPLVINNVNLIQDRVRLRVAEGLEGILAPDEYTLTFRRYGLDAVAWPARARAGVGPDAAPGASAPQPPEIGLVIEATAQSQQAADTVVSLARSTALHQSFPGRKTTAGNLAFPYSPSDISCGPVYEFSLYHLLRLEPHESPARITYVTVGGQT